LNTAIGYGLFSCACICFCVFALLSKLALEKFLLSVPELCYLISCTTVPVFLIFTFVFKQNVFNIPRECQSDLFWRSVTGVFCDVFLFLAYEYTNYSKGFCLFWAGGLVVPFLAYWIIGEPVKKWDIIGISSGIVGMLLIVRPWADADFKGFLNDMIGCSFAIASAITASLALVYIRKLASGEFKINWTINTLYFMIALNLINSLWEFGRPSPKVTLYSGEMYLWALVIGLIFVAQQSLFTAALSFTEAGGLAVINYLAIPFSYFLEWVFIARSLTPLELVGAAIIFFTNVFITVARLKKWIA
jgi:drug/metabolite transporter (DMT)-like permease